MKRIFKQIEEITALKPIPLQTTEVKKCVIYKFWQTAAFTYRLELRIMDFTLEGAESTSAAIIKGISDFGDSNKVDGIPSIVLNGGGVLQDNETNTVQRLLYFDVIIKE